MTEPLPIEEHVPTPLSAASLVGPRKNRIEGLDVARGFALLGIFLVNIDFFSLPFGEVASHDRPIPETTLGAGLFWFVRFFCEGRFYPLFSLLFGIGLVLQRESVVARGGAFVPLYLRRTFLLMLIGLSHGLLFWYGDILFSYSIVALLLLACSGLDRRLLLGLAAVSLIMTLVLLAPLQMLSGAGPTEGVELAAELGAVEQGAVETSVLRDMISEVFSGELEPMDPRYNDLERRAYRDGGFIASATFRVISYFLVTVSFFLGGGLPIITMFFLGAALVRYQLVGHGEAAQRFARRWPLFAVTGIPLGVATGLSYYFAPRPWGLALGQLFDSFAGPTMALFFLSFWSWLAATGSTGWITGGLSAAGKMALTNYLSQTLITTFVMYHWGLGQFGAWTIEQRVAFVAAIWLAQVLASVLWLRYFRFGPLEWLWRSATYLKLQPLKR